MKSFFNNSMKLKYNFGSLLHNRFILYLFFIVALLQLIYFLNINDMFSFSALILVGLLTSFFNKNMTVILFVAIVFTHVIKYGRKSYSEGMDDMESKPESPSDSADKIVADLSKIKEVSEKITEMKNSKDDKKNDLINNLEDIKETRDQIVQNVENMQPLLEKFQGYIDQYKDYKKYE